MNEHKEILEAESVAQEAVEVETDEVDAPKG